MSKNRKDTINRILASKNQEAYHAAKRILLTPELTLQWSLVDEIARKEARDDTGLKWTDDKVVEKFNQGMTSYIELNKESGSLASRE